MTQRKPSAEEARDYAIGSLKVIVAMAKSGKSVDGIQAVAQAGIDLATLGPEKCGVMRGDAEKPQERKDG